MPSIYRVKNGWRAQVRRVGYATRSTVVRTKAEAERWARQVEAEMDAKVYVEPSGTRFRDLVVKYIEQVVPKHKGARWEETRLRRFLRTMPFVAKPADEITRFDIQEWRDARLAEVSGASVNREMNLLSAVFTHAMKEWGVALRVNPVHEVKRPPRGRSRNKRIPPEFEAKLWDYFNQVPDTPPRRGRGGTRDSVPWVFSLAVETAMRLGELCALEWQHVSLGGRWVFVCESKNGTSRYVPLTRRAVSLLSVLGPSDGRVLPVNKDSLGVEFREAVAALGYADLHFHDTRHEGTSRLAEKFDNVLELAAVTGHRDLRSLQIYYNPTPGELARKLD